MTFGVLALVALAGILGPLLGARVSWHVPVVVGELAAGVVFGVTGFGLLDSSDQTFTFLADIGFALTMMVAGSHVPVRDPAVRAAIGKGAVRSVVVGLLSVVAGFGAATAFGTGHAALYAVLIASSSAALILPIVDSLGLGGTSVLQMTAQVAIADTVCIVALPLVIDPDNAPRAGVGALAVAACAVALFFVLRAFHRSGHWRRLHKFSEKRKFALELRINLVILFSLAALASSTHVSIMLAASPSGSFLPRSVNPAASPSNSSRSLTASSRLSSSSGWERRSICATSSPIRPPSGSDWSWAEQLSWFTPRYASSVFRSRSACCPPHNWEYRLPQ